MVEVDWPSGRYEAQTHTVEAGTLLYRILSVHGGRSAVDFNPGFGEPTRFAFFADTTGKTVPVLYTAATPEAALSETLLRDIPYEGGALIPDDYEDKLLVGLRPVRSLQLASFKGVGLRALATHHGEVTSTAPDRYGETVRWAQAAHRAGFDGAAWMSHRCNDAVAVVLFGDSVTGSDIAVDESVARIFRRRVDREWLSDLCRPLRVEIRW